MANSLREVKAKIDATKSTMQITKAMHLVSQAKVRKAERAYKDFNDYLNTLESLISNIMADLESGEYENQLLKENKATKNLYILITADRGLAGAYNQNVYKKFKEITKGIDSNSYFVQSLGKLGHSFIRRNGYNSILEKPILVRDDVMFMDIDPLFNALKNGYLDNSIGKVCIIYNHYINSITTEIRVEELLPFSSFEKKESNIRYNYELGIKETLDEIIPIYIENKIFEIILDAKTAEHMIRMNSMKNATDNASDVISKLQLLYNRARQANITNELIDIVNGAKEGGES